MKEIQTATTPVTWYRTTVAWTGQYAVSGTTTWAGSAMRAPPSSTRCPRGKFTRISLERVPAVNPCSASAHATTSTRASWVKALHITEVVLAASDPQNNSRPVTTTAGTSFGNMLVQRAERRNAAKRLRDLLAAKHQLDKTIPNDHHPDALLQRKYGRVNKFLKVQQ